MNKPGLRISFDLFNRLLAFFLLGMALFAAGCGLKKPVPTKSPQISAKNCWKKFWQRQDRINLPKGGVTMQASLRLSTPKKSHRLSFELWGNYSLPLRLNLKAAFGSLVSLWRADRNKWTAYYPKKNKAFVHKSSRKGISRLGFKTPFDMQEFVYLLSGHWQKTIPRDYDRAEFVPGQGWKYSFPQKAKTASLVLSQDCRPYSLQGKGPEFWNMQFKDYEEFQQRYLPSKILLSNKDNLETVLYLKSIKDKKTTWDQEALELKLPKDAETVQL